MQSNANLRQTQQFYTVAQIAELLDVSQRSVRRWVDRGELVAHRFGRNLRVSGGDFDTFLIRRRGL